MCSLVLVDAKYRFIWASLGAPGNTHDSTCFQSTSLWDEINADKVLPDKNCVIDGVETQPVIWDNGAFLLGSWIVKPHGDAVLTPENTYFNYCLSRARMLMEGVFGKLEGRFRVLFCKCESKKGTVKVMGLACAVLHSLCIGKDDIIPREFDLSYDHLTNEHRSRAELRDMLNLTNSRLKNYDTGRGEGVKVRKAITKGFLDENIPENISRKAFTISTVP